MTAAASYLYLSLHRSVIIQLYLMKCTTLHNGYEIYFMDHSQDMFILSLSPLRTINIIFWWCVALYFLVSNILFVHEQDEGLPPSWSTFGLFTFLVKKTYLYKRSEFLHDIKMPFFLTNWKSTVRLEAHLSKAVRVAGWALQRRDARQGPGEQ